jgi:hypothetical protein
MRSRIPILLALTMAFLAWSLAGSAFAGDKLPSKAAESCLKCHKYDKEPGLFAGRIVSVSKKAKTIQIRVGEDTEVLYFDDGTKVENASSVKKIKNNQATKIEYYVKDGKNFAKKVVVKKGLDVPKEKLASVEEVAKLVAQGPEKGKYVLIDSRPPGLYNEGHVPTAKVMPFFAFEKMNAKVLPKNKDILQIYYCSGFA